MTTICFQCHRVIYSYSEIHYEEKALQINRVIFFSIVLNQFLRLHLFLLSPRDVHYNNIVCYIIYRYRLRFDFYIILCTRARTIIIIAPVQ